MFHFFAYLSRLKHITRWNLMRNVRHENVMEHTCEVAMIAHCLVTIQNTRYGAGLSPDRACSLAVFHETGEVITSDLATAIKYFHPEIKKVFRDIEHIATDKMLNMLPNDMKNTYVKLIDEAENQPEWPYVKAADKICAYLKCVEELKSGNTEFQKAAQSTLKSINELELDSVKDFMRDFAPSYSLALDELN